MVNRRSRRPLLDALRGADVVFLALPLTPQTDGMIGKAELREMRSTAFLINVARGRLVRTDDLVHALKYRWIAGAAIDVTDPEPLPRDHPLWALPNCLITPHSASIEGLAREPFARLVEENVRRFAAKNELLGRINPVLGY
jgi:phosphoglycerate dehydrogenase-like enzyme